MVRRAHLVAPQMEPPTQESPEPRSCGDCYWQPAWASHHPLPPFWSVWLLVSLHLHLQAAAGHKAGHAARCANFALRSCIIFWRDNLIGERAAILSQAGFLEAV